jgi:hypothetical protein
VICIVVTLVFTGGTPVVYACNCMAEVTRRAVTVHNVRLTLQQAVAAEQLYLHAIGISDYTSARWLPKDCGIGNAPFFPEQCLAGYVCNMIQNDLLL